MKLDSQKSDNDGFLKGMGERGWDENPAMKRLADDLKKIALEIQELREKYQNNISTYFTPAMEAAGTFAFLAKNFLKDNKPQNGV